jgi:hypothetical protein
MSTFPSAPDALALFAQCLKKVPDSALAGRKRHDHRRNGHIAAFQTHGNRGSHRTLRRQKCYMPLHYRIGNARFTERCPT